MSYLNIERWIMEKLGCKDGRGMSRKLASAEYKLVKVRKLHPRIDLAPSNPLSPYMCGGCNEIWPCNTVRTLDGNS